MENGNVLLESPSGDETTVSPASDSTILDSPTGVSNQFDNMAILTVQTGVDVANENHGAPTGPLLITTLVKELILMKGLSGTIVMLVIHTLLS
jgi:hypothetical protein